MSQIIHGLQEISSYMGPSRTVEGHMVVFGRTGCRWMEEAVRRFEAISVPQITLWSMRSPAIEMRLRTPFGDRHERLSYHP